MKHVKRDMEIGILENVWKYGLDLLKQEKAGPKKLFDMAMRTKITNSKENCLGWKT